MEDQATTHNTQYPTPSTASTEAVATDVEAQLRKVKDEAARRRIENKSLRESLAEAQAALDAERLAREAAERTATQLEQVAQRQEWVQTVADAYGLPTALANRLQGATREELEADAAQLASVIPPAAAGRVSPGNSGGAIGAPSIPQQIVNRIHATSPSTFFDAAVHLQKGGGVNPEE